MTAVLLADFYGGTMCCGDVRTAGGEEVGGGMESAGGFSNLDAILFLFSCFGSVVDAVSYYCQWSRSGCCLI